MTAVHLNFKQNFAWYRRQAMLPPKKLSIQNTILISFLVSYVISAYFFWAAFPHQWSWGEMLINYKGGFNKRGLVGHIAFLLRHVVSPRFFISGLILSLYLWLTWVFVKHEKMTEHLSGLLFLFSPTGWLWPLLVMSAYGRKDVFVIGAAVCCLTMARTRYQTRSLLLASAFVFTAASFVVEVVWFYYPIVLYALLSTRETESDDVRYKLYAAGTTYGLSFLLLAAALPKSNTEMIAQSWPNGYIENGLSSALCCLNISLSSAVNIGLTTAKNFSGGYAAVLAFGSLPIIIYFSESGFPSGKVLSIACLILAVFFSFTPLVLAADWGRYIYLSLTITFCSLWALKSLRDPSTHTMNLRGLQLIGRISIVLVYASLWQTTHYRDDERSAFIPGVLFRLLGESFMPEGVD